ncbi:MAG: hypothetical protein ACUZ8E_17480 [Candidatus Anammoxibacter sp.]
MLKEYQNKAVPNLENKDSPMASKVKKKKLKLNAPLKNYPIDHVLEIEVDPRGIPLDRYWRDRIKDAKIDNCVEFVKGANK